MSSLDERNGKVTDLIYTDSEESKEVSAGVLPKTTKVIVINGIGGLGRMVAEATLVCKELTEAPASYTKFNSYKRRKKGRS